MQSNQERRAAQRHSLILGVDYGDESQDWTESVSATGLFVQSNKELRNGAPFRAQLSFPGVLEPLDVTGSVVWARPSSTWKPPGLGVAIEAGREELEKLSSACDINTAPPPGHSPTRVLAVGAGVPEGEWRDAVEVLSVRSGDEAMAHAADYAPTVIFTSLFAPLADCLSMIRELRQTTQAQVVALSNDDPDSEARARSAGASAVVGSQTRLDTLVKTVAAVRRSRSR